MISNRHRPNYSNKIFRQIEREAIELLQNKLQTTNKDTATAKCRNLKLTMNNRNPDIPSDMISHESCGNMDPFSDRVLRKKKNWVKTKRICLLPIPEEQPKNFHLDASFPMYYNHVDCSTYNQRKNYNHNQRSKRQRVNAD